MISFFKCAWKAFLPGMLGVARSLDDLEGVTLQKITHVQGLWDTAQGMASHGTTWHHMSQGLPKSLRHMVLTHHLQQFPWWILLGLHPKPWLRQHSAWIGGSMVASVTRYLQTWMTKEEFQRHGASMVRERCIWGANANGDSARLLWSFAVAYSTEELVL